MKSVEELPLLLMSLDFKICSYCNTTSQETVRKLNWYIIEGAVVREEGYGCLKKKACQTLCLYREKIENQVERLNREVEFCIDYLLFNNKQHWCKGTYTIDKYVHNIVDVGQYTILKTGLN